MKKIFSPLCFFSAAALALMLTLALSPSPAYAQAQKDLVDLNKASEKELETLKGVGPATAKKIIENRPYKSVEELSKAGLANKTIQDIKPFVKVGAVGTPAKRAKAEEKATTKPAGTAEKAARAEKTKPAKERTAATEKAKVAEKSVSKLAPGQKVNINTATKEQLEALPEIGPVKAQAIIDGRPYQKPEDIMKVRGIKEGTYNKIKDYITLR